MIKSIKDYREKVMNHYETGTERGLDFGFNCMKELISFKPGYTTYIVGFAAAGKTETHLEILFNLTERYGCRHALLSPEIGSVEDVIAELVSKHLRKPFFKSNPFAVTEREVMDALDFLTEYFYPMDSENDYSIDTFFEDAIKIQKEYKIKLNTVSLDPWNDLNEDLLKFGGREDKYLANALKKMRQECKKNNWHGFIVTHAKEMPPIALKSVTGKDVYCTSVPTLQSFAGGQVWGRRAFNVLGVWRPEIGAIDPTAGIPFEENEAVIIVLKSKPKGVGKKGKANLFFDWKINRYYEFVNGEKYYSWQYEDFLKTQNVEGMTKTTFVMPITTIFDNDPF